MSSGIPFLIGDRVYLRALLESDADGGYPEWFNDPETCRGNSHHVFPYSRDAAQAFIRRVNGTGRTELTLAIVLRDGNKHVGNVALQAIHPVFRSAELAIMIGDRSAWGTGIGHEAARLICDHGFFSLNLHRIACGTFEHNAAMRRLAETLGMREEGLRRQAVFKDGRYVDVVEYGVLHHEYAQGAAKRAAGSTHS